MLDNLDGLVWLLVALVLLLVLQRGLHREIQAIFLLLTRRMDITIVLFSLLFFPGILLHESSHYLFARLMGVRTGRFSLLPRPLPNGKLQLGFVETAPTDWVRDAIIGAAPLVAGGVFVAYAGLVGMGLNSLWNAALTADPATDLLTVLKSLSSQADFWLWLYLTLVVSSTMLPSASDRRAWLPLSLVFAVLLGISLFFGAGPWLAANLAGPLNEFLKAVALVFGISVVVHLCLFPPAWLLRVVLARLMRVRIVL
jgi:hypothetical protein